MCCRNPPPRGRIPSGWSGTGALARFEPNTLGRTEVGWVVDVFDAAEGVVVGTLPGAVDGLAVSVTGAAE